MNEWTKQGKREGKREGVGIIKRKNNFTRTTVGSGSNVPHVASDRVEKGFESHR